MKINAVQTVESKSLITYSEIDFASTDRLGALGIDRTKGCRTTFKGAGAAVVLICEAGSGRDNRQNRKLGGYSRPQEFD